MNLQSGNVAAEKDTRIRLSDIKKTIDIEPALSEIYREKLLRKIRFAPQHNSDKSVFELDNENKISRINWNGAITKKTITKLFLLAADAVEYHGFDKLYIDLSGLVELDTEARINFKEIVKLRSPRILDKVEKIVIIDARSSKGRIFSNMISLVFAMNLPKCPMDKFEKVEDAVEWLLD